MTAEKYKNSNKKSEVDMLFMAATASVLGNKSPETKRAHDKHEKGNRRNVSVLSYHNILKDIKEEPIDGYKSNEISYRDSLFNI